MPDTQTLGLFIAAAVAGAVCVRLYWILGRRRGLEPQAAPPPPQAVPAPVTVVPASGNGLLDIQPRRSRLRHAPSSWKARGPPIAQIVDAFAKGDVAALTPLLSPDVLAAFEAGIRGRGAPPAA